MTLKGGLEMKGDAILVLMVNEDEKFVTSAKNVRKPVNE